MITIRTSRTIAILSKCSSISIFNTPSNTQRYALNPIRAKADLSIKFAQSPSPDIVPIRGPNVRSTYTYEPPEEGIAVASSPLERAPGSTIKAANR